jgi:hypothetical protein
MHRKFFTYNSLLTKLFLLGVIVLSLWQPVSAKSNIYRLQEGQTIELGRLGMSVTNIPYGVSQVSLEKVGRTLPSQLKPRVGVNNRSPALVVRFLSKKGNEVDRISALVYVFFNIGKSERDLWLKNGMETIAIWYVNRVSGSWEICPTFFVNNRQGDASAGRLACRAPGSGAYVLGQGDFSDFVAQAKKTPFFYGMESTSSSQPVVLHVRAYIDGLSQLIIQGDTVYWHHLDWAAPGRHFDAGSNQPTYLNDAKWEPTWPDIPDPENRDCKCDSSPYQGIPTMASTNQQAWVEVVDARGIAKVIQQPATKNDFTLVIEFNDNELMGPAWYEVTVSYIVAENP